MAAQEIKVPDIGDFDSVEVIEVLVSKGDTIEQEQPIITLESDKATLEVPSTIAGKITEMKVSEGDTVSEGDVIALVEADPKKRAAAAQELAAEARSHGIAGQAHFVLLDAEEALREFPGFEPGQQLYVLKPDTFARRAEVLTAFPAKEKKLGTKLLALLPSGRIDKAGQRDHVRQAKRAGISWKSAIPISDVNAISRRGAGR